MAFKALMRRRDSETRGRHLVAEDHIAKGQLIFCERPMILLQSVGNIHSGVLCCQYCMAFVGTPEQSLEIATDPSCLVDITAGSNQDGTNIGEHALVPCRNKCGHVYCSLECQEDDWEWGGHKELCTGLIEDPEHPLLKFKRHAVQSNEIFLLIGQWLTRIHKHNIPYHDDDKLNTHPYTDFTMNPWWDVATEPLRQQPMDFEEASILEKSCRNLCDESHAFLSEAWPDHKDSKWLTPLGMARLIGSLEQNCVGVRRKHPLRLNILQDTELRQSHHKQLLMCLERAGMIGDGGEDGCGDECRPEEEGEDEEPPGSDTDGNTSTVATSDNDNSKDNDEEDKEAVDEGREEWDYSSDEIAEFLSTLRSPLIIGSDDDWDEIFTPLDGTAHLSTLTKMNHSCAANVVVMFKTRGWGRDHPLVAYCIALRDIAPGEELTISYIETNIPYEERQEALANYGFTCTCEKCQAEKNTQGTAKGLVGSDVEKAETDELFGSDDDDDEGEEENDEDALFGGDEDDEGFENVIRDDADLDGETKLQNAAERFESFLNKSVNAAIPLKYLAPVSTHIIKVCNTILKTVGDDSNFAVAKGLVSKCITAVEARDFALCRVVGPDLETVLYRQLKAKGSWPTMVYRHAYWCACITAAIGYAQEASFLVAMKCLDKALIMGQDRRAVEGLFSYVEHYACQMAAAPCPPAIDCKVADISDPEIVKAFKESGLSQPITSPVPETGIDRSEFVKSFSSLTEPLVMRKFAKDWPALSKWCTVDHLAREHGHRLVPIEVGSMDTGMKEELVSFRSFVSKYLSQSTRSRCFSLKEATDPSSNIAYLAQHPLLNQIPRLYEDVPQTPFGLDPTNVNIWLGTGGTRTPLHFDSYDNLFVQLVGAKYIRLYSTDQTSKLYVSKDSKYGLQGNMSEVNCEMEDLDSHPMAKDCHYTEVLMLPGDALFIPSRHWHYVRSLSTSISINYWF